LTFDYEVLTNVYLNFSIFKLYSFFCNYI